MGPISVAPHFPQNFGKDLIRLVASSKPTRIGCLHAGHDIFADRDTVTKLYNVVQKKTATDGQAERARRICDGFNI